MTRLGLLIIPAILMTTTLAHADDVATLEARGDKALADGQYVAALASFKEANRVSYAPLHWLGIARAEAGLGDLVEARHHYGYFLEETLTTPDPHRAEALAENAAIEKRLARLTIVVTGGSANPVVALDGLALASTELETARDANPGPHVVRVDDAGFAAVEEKISLSENGEGVIHVRLVRGLVKEPVGAFDPEIYPDGKKPELRDDGSFQRAAGWVGIAFGATSFLGGLALIPSKNGFASAGLIIGGGLVGITGAAALYTAPTPKTISPYVGLGSIGATGSF